MRLSHFSFIVILLLLALFPLHFRCMITRSRGASNLTPTVEEIATLEREIARKRREEEQQAHLQRLGFDMENPH